MGARAIAARWLSAVAVAVLCMAGFAAAQSARAYTGPNAIAVPYAEEKVVKPADGYAFDDCAAIRSAGGELVTACDPHEGFTVKSPGYDPEYGEVIVPVKTSNGRTATTIDYVLFLEPPEVPELPETRYPYPAPAGGTLMIPISDLGVTCTACTAGSGLEVTSFAPQGAATVLPTETHLVVRPHDDFEGPLEITLRYGDMWDGWSPPTVLTVSVSKLDADAPIAQHVMRPMPEKTGEFDLNELVHLPAGAEGAQILCGAALHGTVVCDGEGHATYTPTAPAAVDEFAFRVSQHGDLVTGSVVLVADGAETGLPVEGQAVSEPRTDPTPAPQPPEPDPEETQNASGRRGKKADTKEQQMVLLRVPSPVVPKTPPADGGGLAGIFTPLIETMNRAGAR
ncbi:hypothetical protein [Microbacterium stercoris]|uniref:Uncharacterized protein n=1 Tax=Microbacterium stercoris TaxID=2820289 RepID=A0A939QHG2_9MICO|nr:hypothetical protein [Microbacterium stercoris]MBO3662739.1 hypothetical protein [Microbacterium stercoris]